MEDLLFDGAEVPEGFKNEYLEVGNHKVEISEVIKGKSSQKGSPYIQITVQNKDGQKCSQQYYLNGGAWNISKSAILTIVAAALGVDAENAKNSLQGLNTENIDQKLSSIIVGKKIGITLNGEWINPEDMTKKSWVKATFGSYKFAVPLSEFNTLSKKEYIKGQKDNRAANGVNETQNVPAGAIVAEDEEWN